MTCIVTEKDKIDKIIKEITTLYKLHRIKKMIYEKFDIDLFILNFYGFWYEIEEFR